MELKSGILSANLKVQGGKLLKCKLELENDIIRKIKITGDFFMHPEEKIEDLEKVLIGIKFDNNEIRKVLLDFYSRDVLVIGADAEDFVTLIMSAK